jgi:hypothetical protein
MILKNKNTIIEYNGEKSLRDTNKLKENNIIKFIDECPQLQKIVSVAFIDKWDQCLHLSFDLKDLNDYLINEIIKAVKKDPVSYYKFVTYPVDKDQNKSTLRIGTWN